MRSILPISSLALVLTLFAQDKPKEKPIVRYAQPLVLERGKKEKVILRGAKLEGIKEIASTQKNVTFGKPSAGKKVALPNNVPEQKFGETEVEVEIDLKAEFIESVLTLTATTANGNSEPFSIAVATKRLNETEPNDSIDKAQEIERGIWIEAVIGRERDIDCFRFAGKKGEKIAVAIVAAKIGSPADLHLTLCDDKKRVLKIVDDVDGKPDPSLTIELPADGTYTIVVIEANDLGHAAFGYRLRVDAAK